MFEKPGIAFQRWLQQYGGTSASNPMRTIVQKIYSPLLDIGQDAVNLVESVLPYTLIVLGILVAVSFGLKFIKKVMK